MRQQDAMMHIRHTGGGEVKTMCKQRTGRAHYASDQYMFADGIALVCFYDAERVLSNNNFVQCPCNSTVTVSL